MSQDPNRVEPSAYHELAEAAETCADELRSTGGRAQAGIPGIPAALTNLLSTAVKIFGPGLAQALIQFLQAKFPQSNAPEA